MSKIGDSIICGLKEAVEYMEGVANPEKYIRHDFAPANIPENLDVKAIRQTLGLSQSKFSQSFGLSLHALRNWEQGKRKPDPAARAYLKVIAFSPETVRKALESE